MAESKKTETSLPWFSLAGQNDDIVLIPLSKAIHQKKDVKEDSWQALLTLSI